MSENNKIKIPSPPVIADKEGDLCLSIINELEEKNAKTLLSQIDQKVLKRLLLDAEIRKDMVLEIKREHFYTLEAIKHYHELNKKPYSEEMQAFIEWNKERLDFRKCDFQERIQEIALLKKYII